MSSLKKTLKQRLVLETFLHGILTRSLKEVRNDIRRLKNRLPFLRSFNLLPFEATTFRPVRGRVCLVPVAFQKRSY